MNFLAARAPPNAAAFPRDICLQRKQPQPQRHTSNPSGFSKPGKRARDNVKETRTHGSDDDESDGSTADHPLEHRARGPEVFQAKPLRIKANLTRSFSFYRLA